MFYVYVIYDTVKDKFYIGSTGDLKRRIDEHLSGYSQTTSRMKSLKLVYYEASLSKKDALVREKHLKTGFGRGYLRKRIKDYLNK